MAITSKLKIHLFITELLHVLNVDSCFVVDCFLRAIIRGGLSIVVFTLLHHLKSRFATWLSPPSLSSRSLPSHSSWP